MKVTNTHGLGIDEIAQFAVHIEKPYTRQTLTVVVMSIGETISQTLGCSCLSGWRYVNRWNKQGMEAATDYRDGSQSLFTEETL
jgi:transposase